MTVKELNKPMNHMYHLVVDHGLVYKYLLLKYFVNTTKKFPLKFQKKDKGQGSLLRRYVYCVILGNKQTNKLNKTKQNVNCYQLLLFRHFSVVLLYPNSLKKSSIQPRLKIRFHIDLSWFIFP